MNSRTRAAIAAFLALGLLTGCTSLPPIWPMSEPQSAFPAYPTKDAGTTPVSVDDCNKKPTDATKQLNCAQQEAVRVLQVFAAAKRTIEATKNGGILALFGLGTAAGVNVATSASTGVLKSLGLAAAGIAGLSSTLGIDGQHDAYGAGVTAVSCLIKVDAALEDARNALSASRPLISDAEATAQTIMQAGYTPATVREIFGSLNIAGADNSKDSESLMSSAIAGNVNSDTIVPGLPILPNLDSLRIIKQNQQIAIAGGLAGPLAANTKAATAESQMKVILQQNAATSYLDALAFIQDANNSTAALRAATIKATEPGHRAQDLVDTLNAIKQAVADRLYSNVDLSKIFDTLKSGLQKAGGNSVGAQQDAKTAGGKAAGAGGSALTGAQSPTANRSVKSSFAELDQPDLSATAFTEAFTDLSAPANIIAVMQLQLAKIQKDIDAAQPLADKYAECVADAKPPVKKNP
jgi:hypothetical protein